MPTILNKGLYGYYLFLVVSMAYVFSYSHADSFMVINQIHNPFLDFVMPAITFLGDGIFAIGIVLLLSFVRIRHSMYIFMSYAFSGIAVQMLKRLVFEDRLRPLAYFNQAGIEIYTLEGMNVPKHFSFPSGHSATAFAIFIGLSFMVKQWYLKVLFLLVAIIVGFSRVYLAVHFPVDVIGGSLLGVLAAFLCFIWVSGWKKPWLDVSLKALFYNALKK